jgi:hypothetical protein
VSQRRSRSAVLVEVLLSVVAKSYSSVVIVSQQYRFLNGHCTAAFSTTEVSAALT